MGGGQGNRGGEGGGGAQFSAFVCVASFVVVREKSRYQSKTFWCKSSSSSKIEKKIPKRTSSFAP